MLYRVLKSVLNLVFRILYRVELVNPDGLKGDGKLIICANHVHIFDPVLISAFTRDQVFWMGKKELFENKLFAGFLRRLGSFPVDRENTELSTLRHSMKLLKDGHILGIFPEGTRVKSFDLKNAKPGVALISIKTKTPVLPVYIEASYRPFSKVRLVVGQPLDFHNQEGRLSGDDYRQYGELVLEEIYKLK